MNSSFESLCETLYIEILKHPHKEELVKLIQEQVADDTLLQNVSESKY